MFTAKAPVPRKCLVHKITQWITFKWMNRKKGLKTKTNNNPTPSNTLRGTRENLLARHPQLLSHAHLSFPLSPPILPHQHYGWHMHVLFARTKNTTQGEANCKMESQRQGEKSFSVAGNATSGEDTKNGLWSHSPRITAHIWVDKHASRTFFYMHRYTSILIVF